MVGDRDLKRLSLPKSIAPTEAVQTKRLQRSRPDGLLDIVKRVCDRGDPKGPDCQSMGNRVSSVPSFGSNASMIAVENQTHG